jgi:tetratricopeptide (TPR) repeat protein
MGNSASKYYKEAVNQHNKKNYENAVTLYDKALRVDRNNIEYLNLKGLSLESLSKYDEAYECYSTSYSLKSENIYALNGLGNISYKKGNYNESLEYFSKIIDIDDKNLIAYNNQGNSFRCCNRHNEALAAFDIAIEIDNSYSLAHYNKGYVYFLNRNYDEALKCYSTACELKKESDLYNYSKGLVLHNLGRYSEAIDAFEVAIQNNPLYSSAISAKEQSENKLKSKDNMSENVMMTNFNKNFISLSKESCKTVELTSYNYIHNETSNDLESNFNYESIVVAHKSVKANPFHKDGNREPSSQYLNLDEIVLQSADKKSLKTLDTISSDDKKKFLHQMMYEYLLKYKENKIDMKEIKFVKEGENNKIIGMGTFGIVYLGKINHVEYAVKFLNPKNEKEVEFIQNELDNLFNLKHPHLSSIYFWTSDIQGFYFVMEYYKKGDLFNYIKEHKAEISLGKKIDFFIQIASALDYLHKMNKQHNDIKSSNVFVAHRDKVVLGDFGFTKTLTHSVFCSAHVFEG